MKIEITKIKLLTQEHGPDIIWAYTDLPCPFITEFLSSQPKANFQIKASAKTGLDYIKKNFSGVEVEIVALP